MLPDLTSLVALQALDTAADTARKRLAELPAAEQAIEMKLGAATAAADGAKARFTENQQARRALEKDVAGVDARLSRFDDHKAAVKTNHEYTALLHEIATAKTEKEALEERILILMEAADVVAAEMKTADAAVIETAREATTARSALVNERRAIEADASRLATERGRAAQEVPAPLLARYDQLVKQRRGVAVAKMIGEMCEACHVRLRPSVTLQVRRNAEIVQCDSCQRILYFEAPEAPQPIP